VAVEKILTGRSCKLIWPGCNNLSVLPGAFCLAQKKAATRIKVPPNAGGDSRNAVGCITAAWVLVDKAYTTSSRHIQFIKAKK